MGSNVELTVKTQLDQIIRDFETLNKKVREVQGTLKTSGDEITESFTGNVKKTETFLGQLRSLGTRVSDQLKSDFKSLLSLNAVAGAMKISNQFKGAIDESINLNDTVRKLGTTFGLNKSQFVSFQTAMVKGLGEIGLASDIASRTMESLADTPVRGQKQLLQYSKVAGQLASISGQQGQEGGIAKGIAEVIRASGGNVNDTGAVKNVAEDLRRVFNVTGKGPAETLKAMQELFTAMPKDLRKNISTRGLASLAAAGQIAGPNSTKFLEEFLSKSKIQRTALEAQGFKGVFTNKGIDVDKFQKAAKDVLNRIGGDPRMAAKTLGLTDEAADGFVRLAESMDKVKDAQNRINTSTGNLNSQYQKSMGFTEAFKANVNRVKSMLSGPLSYGIGKMTDVMSGASKSNVGATAMVAGGGVLAALLAGYGLKGIGGGLLGGMFGGMAKAKGIEALTGEKVQNVYVVNASEIGGGISGALSGGAGAAAGGVAETIGGTTLGKIAIGAASAAAMTGGAALVGGLGGYQAGKMINEKLVEKTQGTTEEGFQGNAIERLIFKIDKLFGGENAKNIMASQQALTTQKVIVEARSKELRVTKPSRGVSQ